MVAPLKFHYQLIYREYSGQNWKKFLYKRFVDGVFNRKKKHKEDTLLSKLNVYHPKIKFAVEKDLSKFLDTKLQLEDGKYKTRSAESLKIT